MIFRALRFTGLPRGYVVDPDVAYDLKVEGEDTVGTFVASAINGQYAFARGAIVNMKVTL